jgi:D-alanyl-D-alanine carboxypeptidase (penicillin-binding protein 5/6)
LTSTVEGPAGLTGESAPAGPAATALEAPDPETPAASERPQRVRRRRNRRRIKWSLAALAVVVAAVVGLVAAQRVDRTMPQPTMTAVRHVAYPVHGRPPVLPWPPAGQAAVAIPSLGYAQQSGPEPPVPVASLAKMTTAVVVLHDHPVPPGSDGPAVTVTPDEAAQFGVDLENDETNIPLQTGESLTEVQLLEALMNQSANDAAYVLAVWDSGSEAAFVAKMNGLDRSLGALHTHFVDSSGYQPQSVSTAADMLRIAAAGMTIPTFARVVAMPTVSLPLVGTVHNIVREIGTGGVVGVKSGYTAQSAGCMVLASYRTVLGHRVLVLASALGQRIQPPIPYNALEAQYPLLYTGPVVERLLDATGAAVTTVVVARPGEALGTATAVWGGVERQVPAVATQGAAMPAVPGQRFELRAGPVGPSTRRTARGQVGLATFTLGPQTEVVPLVRLHPLAQPPWSWKLLHG